MCWSKFSIPPAIVGLVLVTGSVAAHALETTSLTTISQRFTSQSLSDERSQVTSIKRNFQRQHTLLADCDRPAPCCSGSGCYPPDKGSDEDPVEKLRRNNPELYKKLYSVPDNWNEMTEQQQQQWLHQQRLWRWSLGLP
ncbi:MAG: hypothetical protein JO235_13715 [Chroococcidiopsidaceae cyanobacterium CP_BM_RX_35]|nr:hypothetical protein [Chroococcidiopsidaceae cyanobacterium CP_BM_RX_35]